MSVSIFRAITTRAEARVLIAEQKLKQFPIHPSQFAHFRALCQRNPVVDSALSFRARLLLCADIRLCAPRVLARRKRAADAHAVRAQRQADLERRIQERQKKQNRTKKSKGRRRRRKRTRRRRDNSSSSESESSESDVDESSAASGSDGDVVLAAVGTKRRRWQRSSSDDDNEDDGLNEQGLDENEPVLQNFVQQVKPFFSQLDRHLALFGFALTTFTKRGDLVVLDPELYDVSFTVDNQGQMRYIVTTTHKVQKGAPRTRADRLRWLSAIRRGDTSGGVPPTSLSGLPSSDTSGETGMDLTAADPTAKQANKATPPRDPNSAEQHYRRALADVKRADDLELDDSSHVLNGVLVVQEREPYKTENAGKLNSVFLALKDDEMLHNTLTTSSRLVTDRATHPMMLAVETNNLKMSEMGRMGPYVMPGDINQLQAIQDDAAGARAAREYQTRLARDAEERTRVAASDAAAIQISSRKVRNPETGRLEYQRPPPGEVLIQHLPKGQLAMEVPMPHVPTEMLRDVSLRLNDVVMMLLGIPASIQGSLINPNRVNLNHRWMVDMVVGQRREIFNKVAAALFRMVLPALMIQRFFASGGRTLRDLRRADEATDIQFTFGASADALNNDRLFDQGAIGVDTYIASATAYSSIAPQDFSRPRLITRMKQIDGIRAEELKQQQLQTELMELQARTSKQQLKTMAIQREQIKRHTAAAQAATGLASGSGSGSKGVSRPATPSASAVAPLRRYPATTASSRRGASPVTKSLGRPTSDRTASERES